MPDGVITIPVETDIRKVIDNALDYMIANIPGWLPSDAHVETWLIQTFGRLSLYRANVDALVSLAIFRYFGRSVLQLPPVDSARATTATTWTFIDDQGYTVPAGTKVGFRVAGDQLIPFSVDTAVTVAPGLDTTPSPVPIRALDGGDAGNGLSGTVELIDTLAFVDTITTVAATSGGADPETDDEYLARLAEELSIAAPRPIIPSDFEVMARRIPGVHRALAIDGYNPDDDTFDNERMVAVAVVDEDGSTVGSTVKDAVDELLQRRREINFVVNVIDPDFTDITVVFTASALPGYDTGILEAAVVAALDDYLSPGKWGGGDERPPAWRYRTHVRYLEIATVINNVPGVDEISALTVNGGTVDIELVGVAPLPNPLNNTGTIT